MTLRGFVVTLLELVLLVFAFGTEMHEFLIVALGLGVLEIYSFVSILLASVTLNIRSGIDKSAAERLEGAEYTLSLIGIALLPVAGYLSVKNADFEDKKLKRRKLSFLILPSFIIERRFDFHIPCVHVGLWEVGVKKLRIEDVFGLFSFRLIRSRRTDCFVNLSVIPQIHHIQNENETDSMGDYGQSSMLDSEQGELLGDSRLYREGDTLKRINWKLSARTKTLYSRQFEMLQNPRIAIVIDTVILNSNYGDIIDIITESAISISEYFLKNNHTVDIILLREKGETQNKVYTLSVVGDVLKMQNDFARVRFYPFDEPLELTTQDNISIMNADKVFLISANPSNTTVSKVTELCNTGRFARCIIPSIALNEFLEDEEEEAKDEITVEITSADQIRAKVGGVL